MRVTLLLVLGLVGAADEPAASAVRNDMKRLQGTWTVASATTNGKKLEEALGQQLVFAGDQLTIRDNSGKHVQKARYTLDPSRKPKTIDFTPEKPSLGTAFGQAIYRFQADGTLELCVGPPEHRPTDFKDKKQLLFVLKKKS